MIQVTFSKRGGSIRLRLTGHAGFAPAGQDIVCAAASILAYTAAQVAQTMEEEGKLSRKPVIRLKSGDILVLCSPKKRHYAAAMQAFSVVQEGYKLAAASYPDYLDLTVFDTGPRPGSYGSSTTRTEHTRSISHERI